MLLDTDPQYNFTWFLVPFNGATEHELEWNFKVSCDYLPLEQRGFTQDEVFKLNDYFNGSDYKQITRRYTMENFREEYAAFKLQADIATADIIKKAL